MSTGDFQISAARRKGVTSRLSGLYASHGQEIVILAAIIVLFGVVSLINPRFVSPG